MAFRAALTHSLAATVAQCQPNSPAKIRCLYQGNVVWFKGTCADAEGWQAIAPVLQGKWLLHACASRDWWTFSKLSLMPMQAAGADLAQARKAAVVLTQQLPNACAGGNGCAAGVLYQPRCNGEWAGSSAQGTTAGAPLWQCLSALKCLACWLLSARAVQVHGAQLPSALRPML